MVRGGYVYILTNKTNSVLYTGVTSNLKNRIYVHREKLNKTSFTYKYNVTKLVFFETFLDIEVAIAREKQIKAGSRAKKIELIERMNPEWMDLSEEIEDYI
jgi:putative endonuclease